MIGQPKVRSSRPGRQIALAVVAGVAVCGLGWVCAVTPFGDPLLTSRAAQGAEAPQHWVQSENAVSGHLPADGPLGTSSAEEYAFGLDYAGPTAGEGIAITGEGTDAPAGDGGAVLRILPGDTLTGGAAAWSSNGVSGLTVQGVAGEAPDPTLGGLLQTTARAETADGAAQLRWQIAAATAALVNDDGGPATIAAQAVAAPGSGEQAAPDEVATGQNAVQPIAGGGNSLDARVQVFVVDPELSATLEACVSGTSCSVDAGLGEGGWSSDGELGAQQDQVWWRVIATNTGNVELHDVRTATAVDDTETIQTALSLVFGDIAAGSRAVATFVTAPHEVSSAQVSVSGVFDAIAPDGQQLADRFVDAAGITGRVPSAQAKATLTSLTKQEPRDSSAGQADGDIDAGAGDATAGGEHPDGSQPDAEGEVGSGQGEVPSPPWSAPDTVQLLDLVLPGPTPSWVLTTAWVTTATSVQNGASVTGKFNVALNDGTGLGQSGAVANAYFSLTANHAVFTVIPGDCLTTGVSPVSAILNGGNTLRCNLGSLPYGSARSVQFAVTASGANGDTLAVAVAKSPEGVPVATTPTKSITANTGIDVVFDTALTQRFGPSRRWVSGSVAVMFGVKVPTGAAWPTGAITFRVTVGSGSAGASNTPTAVKVAGCQPNAAYATMTNATIPASAGLYPTCSVAATGTTGDYDVTLTNYTAPPTTFPTTSALGQALPSGFTFIAVGALTLESTAALGGTSATVIPLTVSTLRVNGATRTESNTGNNTTNVTMDVNGNWVSSLAGPALSSYTAWSTQGARYSGAGTLTAGQHFSVRIDNAYFNGYRVSDMEGQNSQEYCVSNLGGTFDGSFALDSEFIDWGVQVSLSISTTSGNPSVGSGGVVDGTTQLDCTSGSWTSTAFGSQTAAISGTTAYKNTAGTPANWKRMKIRVVYPTSVTAMLPTQNLSIWFGQQVPNPVPSGTTGVWGLASTTNRTGVWQKWSGAQINIGATPYLSTYSHGVDYAKIVSWTPKITKTGSASSAGLGDEVTFTLKPTPFVASGGATAASYTVKDTLPSGMSYVTGSAAPAPTSVSGQTLTWNVSGTTNTAATITLRARITATSGVLENTAAMNASSSADPAATASASVRVLTSSETLLLKQAGDPQIPLGAAMTSTWKILLTNDDAAAQASTDIIDIFPYVGDGRGTVITGSAPVPVSVSLNAGESLYCTSTAPALLNPDPSAAANAIPGGSGGWAACNAAALSPATKAIRVVGGSLAATSTKTNTIRWSLNGSQALGDVYYNVANARAAGTALLMSAGAYSEVVLDGSTLQVHKQFVSASGWNDGDTITWLVQVRNASTTNTAYRVTVTDAPDTGLVASAASDIVWGTAPAGTATNGWSWNLDQLAPQATQQIQVTTKIDGTVQAGPGKRFVNYVTVENPSNPYTQRPRHDIIWNATVQADTDQSDGAEASAAQVSKSFEPGKISLGSTAVATFTVTNSAGNPARSGMRFTDTLPAGLTVALPVGVTNTCGGTVTAVTGGNTIVLSGGTMAAGTVSCLIQVNVTSTTPGTYANCATNLSSMSSLLPPESCATLRILANYSLQKSSDPVTGSTVSPGQTVIYRVTATPDAPGGPVDGLVMTDDLSDVLGAGKASFVSGSAMLSRRDTVTNTVVESWPVADPTPADPATLVAPAKNLAATDQLVLSYEVKVADEALGGETLVNLATARDWNDLPPSNCGPGTGGGQDPCSTTHTVQDPQVEVYIQKLAELVSGEWGPMAGSSWQILADSGGTPGSNAAGVTVSDVAGSTGLVHVTGLVGGTSYWLVETQTPVGFSLLAQPVRFTVAIGGAVTLEDGAGAGANATVTAAEAASSSPQAPWFIISVRDVPIARMPMAGGTGDAWVLAAGLLCVFAGGVSGWLVWLRRRTSAR